MIHVYPDPSDATLASIYAAVAALDTSNLDVAVSTRASQSSVDTIDANVDAIKADTDAYLDAAVSSVKFKPQGNVIRDTSVLSQQIAASSTDFEGYGELYTAGALTASTYSTLLNITASGFLWVVVTYRAAAITSATLSTRITIDGAAWDVVTDSATATALYGHAAHGVMSAGRDVVCPVMVRFNTSLKVEVMSSVDQLTSKVASRILYSVDA